MRISGFTFIKTMLFLMCVVYISGFIYFGYVGHLKSKKYLYCGTIIDKGYEPPSSGYKSSRDAVYYVIMKENLSNKGMRINVNVPTYYSLNKGSNTCFTVSNKSLYNYGNTQDDRKNFYGK